LGTNVLVKIAADGTTIALGPVSGLPSEQYFSGEMDENGNLYVIRSGNRKTMFIINVATMTATSRVLSESVNVYDLGYSISNGLLYTVNRAGTASTVGALTTIDPATGTVSFIGGPDSQIDFGAMYGSSTGEIFGNYNTGGFYQFNITTGERTLISNSPNANGNDGAHCVTAPITFSADLSAHKINAQNTYDPGVEYTTTYTIKVTNNGPFGVVNAVVEDDVPAGIPSANMTYTALPTLGCTTSVVGTEVGKINDLVSLPVGGSVTYTVQVTIPATFTGDLVNTVNITNPTNSTDPDTTDNTATDTDTRAVITTVITNRKITYRPKKH